MRNHFCTYGRHWVKVRHIPRYDINEPCEACKVRRRVDIEAMRQEHENEHQRQRGLRA